MDRFEAILNGFTTDKNASDTVKGNTTPEMQKVSQPLERGVADKSSNNQAISFTDVKLICNKHKAGYTIDEISEDLRLTAESVTGVIKDAQQQDLYEDLASLR